MQKMHLASLPKLVQATARLQIASCMNKQVLVYCVDLQYARRSLVDLDSVVSCGACGRHSSPHHSGQVGSGKDSPCHVVFSCSFVDGPRGNARP